MDIIINNDTEKAPKGSIELITQGNAYLNFLVSLGYEPTAPPIADMLRQYHGLTGKWLMIAPIYWEATHNDAMIIAAGRSLDLTEDESKTWFAAINDFFAEEGLSLYYHNADTWLLKVNDKPSLISVPVHLMINQSIMPALAKMDETLYWQRILTELQMFLTNHPYNKQRENKCPINGVWLYGQGSFDITTTRPIISDDAVLLSRFPTHIKPFVESEPLEKNSIIFRNSQDYHCKEGIKKYATRWYWNNKAYALPKTHWWQRLFRG
jgi:hypothetical protein